MSEMSPIACFVSWREACNVRLEMPLADTEAVSVPVECAERRREAARVREAGRTSAEKADGANSELLTKQPKWVDPAAAAMSGQWMSRWRRLGLWQSPRALRVVFRASQ